MAVGIGKKALGDVCGGNEVDAGGEDVVAEGSMIELSK